MWNPIDTVAQTLNSRDPLSEKAFRSARDRWTSFACLTLLALFFSFYAKRELEAVQGRAPAAQLAGDFRVYYTAGRVVTLSRDPQLYYPPCCGPDAANNALYRYYGTVDPNTEWGRVTRETGFATTAPFNYPPFAAVMFSFLGRFPEGTAYLLWRVLSSVLVVVGVCLAVLIADSSSKTPVFLLAIVGAFTFFPVVETLYLAQAGALIFSLWTLGTYLMKREQPVWSALCFAVATMAKVTPILVVALFLMRRQWKWLGAFTVWMVLLLSWGVWRVGLNNHLHYIREVFPTLSCGAPGYKTKSLPSLIQNLSLGRVPMNDLGDLPMISPIVCAFNKVIALACFLGTLFVFYRKNKTVSQLPYELAFLALLSLFISPVSWRNHYVLALLPLIYVWIRSRNYNLDWQPANLAILAAATLAMGTPFPDYVIVAVHSRAVQLALSAIVPITTLLLLVSSLKCYPSPPRSTVAAGSQ
jgi:hypothetical protein